MELSKEFKDSKTLVKQVSAITTAYTNIKLECIEKEGLLLFCSFWTNDLKEEKEEDMDLKKLSKIIIDAQKDQAIINKKVANFIDDQKKINESFLTFMKEQTLMNQKFSAFMDEQREINQIVLTFMKEQREVNQEFREFMKEQREFNINQTELNQEFREFMKEQREFNINQTELNQEFREFMKEQREYNERNEKNVMQLQKDVKRIDAVLEKNNIR
ncbi:hypothetical protein [Mycoplasmopsis agassizii]|uniref:Uncharacterized protein n=1 Tax=Mycoplasmopsis agassizii TaxID=33922 RepID=A0ABX4H4K7_9BACT|nr:hypothetical protein [Mycoplasmopsis agassizii]PAF54825.1 hypothetical protein CJF60_03765 [Mycoplasmopsis agassizii]SMC18660.1 hypothetical protein SAMN02745179_00743 [Mycoplasmopsis agassizii]